LKSGNVNKRYKNNKKTKKPKIKKAVMRGENFAPF
jgi:hypothetical protein